MRDDDDLPLSLGRLALRTLVVPALVVAVAIGAVMAVLNAVQPARRPTTLASRELRSTAKAHRRGPDPAASAHQGSPSGRRARHPASPASRPRNGPRPRTAVARLGAYVGPADAAAFTALSARVPGGLSGAMDYLDDRTWSSIEDPSWFLRRWQPLHVAMTYLVPMLPVSGASLEAGAAGAYDAAFRELATTLVGAGQGGATLVLGSSPLEPGQPWSVYTLAAAEEYVAFYRRIVTVMRAVPGARFAFAYQPGPVAPSSTVGPGRCYPGNRYVSVVATQVFDQRFSPSTLGVDRFQHLLREPFGLAWTARLAGRQHRRLLIDGLGLVPVADGGAGDDPGFVSALLAWAHRHHVAGLDLWSDGDVAFLPGTDPRSFAVVASLVRAGELG